jgi:hypothetical protein
MSYLDLMGALAERSARLLWRGGPSAVGGALVAPLVLSGPLMVAGIVTMAMPVLVVVLVPLALALPLSAYAAALAALTHAIDGKPSVNDAIEQTFDRPTLGLFWAVPLIGVLGLDAAFLVDAHRGRELAVDLVFGLVLLVCTVAACVAIGRIALALVVQFAEGPLDAVAVRERVDELLGKKTFAPIFVLAPPGLVLGVAVAGWWNPIANETLLGLATLGAIFAAALLLAAMPPALYAVLRAAHQPDPLPAPRGEGVGPR